MKLLFKDRSNQSGLLINSHGFTLLELLISITILGIMMAVIMGSLRLGSRAWEKGEAKAEFNQKLRVVLDHMLEEIRSAHSLHIVSDDEEIKYHAFWGEPYRIRFITTSPGLESEPGLAFPRAVEYFVEAGSGLAMRTVPCLGGDCFGDLENQDMVVLDDNVSEIGFRFCYIPEPKPGEDVQEQPECEWVDTWDPTSKEAMGFGKLEGEEVAPGPPVQKLPNAVEISLNLEFGEEEQNRQLPPLYVSIYLGKEIALPKEEL